MSDVRIREGRRSEVGDVVALLDRAMLAFDRDAISDRIDRGAVLVAVEGNAIRGAAVLAGSHIEAIAVDRTLRGRGIGRQLVESAAERCDRVTAACHPQAAGFYRSLDFRLYSLPSERMFGYRSDQTSGSTSS